MSWFLPGKSFAWHLALKWVRIGANLGYFQREMSLGDLKLLELIYALLTTTGCGQSLGRPQPIEPRFSAVNRFVGLECEFYCRFAPPGRETPPASPNGPGRAPRLSLHLFS